MKTQTILIGSALGLLCGVALIGADSHYNKLQDAGLVATNETRWHPSLTNSNAVLKVEWWGNIVTTGRDRDRDRIAYMEEYQLGLRADGVVVWRKAQQ